MPSTFFLRVSFLRSSTTPPTTPAAAAIAAVATGTTTVFTALFPASATWPVFSFAAAPAPSDCSAVRRCVERAREFAADVRGRVWRVLARPFAVVPLEFDDREFED